MDELQEARRRFEKIARGEYVPKPMSVEEAKARLREADPGLDLSDVIAALDEGDLQRAGLALFRQSVAPQAIAYFAPLLAEAMAAALEALEEGAEKGTEPPS